MSLEEGTRVLLLIPFTQRESQTLAKTLDFLLQKGYTRVFHNGKLQKIEALIEDVDSVKNPTEDLKILIDRFVATKDDEDNAKRIADSSQIALQEGHGICIIQDTDGNQEVFNNKFELDGILFEEPTPQLFNFNSSFGACPSCEGYGQVMGIDEDKVIPDKTKSIFEEAIVCWRGEKIGRWRQKFLNVAHQLDFPVHTPYRELTEEQRRVLWTGNELFDGIDTFLKN